MSNVHKIRILYWNADGIRTKIHELLDLLNERCIDIVAVNETRISSNATLLTPGFKCYRQDKLANGHGQGVAILIRSYLVHTPAILPTMNNLECVGLQLFVSGKPITIVSAYQSPNLPLLTSDLNKVTNISANMIIMGDLNSKHPYWHCFDCNVRGKVLFDHMVDGEYDIVAPLNPTLVHYDASHEASIPDLAIVKGIDTLSELCALTCLSSNHLPVVFDIRGDCVSKPTETLDYSKVDWKKFRTLLDQKLVLTSLSLNTVTDIDAAIAFVTESIIDARDLTVPKISFSYNKLKLPRRIKSTIRLKNNLKRQTLQEENCKLKKQLSRQVNQLQRQISSTIKAHNDALWNKRLARVDNPSSDIWRIVRSLNHKQISIPPLKTGSGSFSTSVSEQCEVLAEAFLENMKLTEDWVSDPETESSVENSITYLDNSNISGPWSFVRPHEIHKLLKRLKSRKAPGYDGIHNMLLKNMSQKCVIWLTKIFNGCLKFGYFPTVFKHAKVIPIKKPGKDNNLAISYRPISLLPVLGKLLETILLNRISRFAEDTLLPEQFGFRKMHSTVQQLARVSEHISHCLNLKRSTGMILLDIEKAFDTVWHAGLLHKLIKSSIPLRLVKLIQSYLENRTFSVSLDDQSSCAKYIPAGIPQGSILGPYLFIIYLNDTPKQPHTHLAIYADDTATYSSEEDIDLVISRLQLSVELLSNYFCKWKLKLNSNKTEAIMFTRKRSLPKRLVRINSFPIPWSKSVRYLGITLDNKLNWSCNANQLVIKGTKATCALRPILNRKSKISSQTKLRIYATLIRPCLTYAAPVWSSLADTNYNKLQVVQNKAIKIAYNTPFKTNLKLLHSKIKFPLIKNFILKTSRKFYLLKNPAHSNSIISSIAKTRIKVLSYAATYNRYRLPHHYFLNS